MFTGIIKEIGIIKKIIRSPDGLNIGIKSKLKLLKSDLGTSINCSGVCLTFEKISKGLHFFYLSKDSLHLPLFRYLEPCL